MKKTLFSTAVFVCLFTLSSLAQSFDNQSYKITWLIEGSKYTLIDTKTRSAIVPPIYDEARLINEEISLVRKGEKYGIINNSGEHITAFVYDEAVDYNKNLVLVKKENKYSFLKKEMMTADLGFAGRYEPEEEYDLVIYSFSDEFGIVMLAGKYGYIDAEGQEVIPLMFDGATIFDDEVAAVKVGEFWGAIDRTGNERLPFEFNLLEAFKDGKAVGQREHKWGVIDAFQTEVVPFEYKNMTRFNDSNVALAQKGKKWGLLNGEGEVVVPFEYDFDEDYVSLMDLTDGYVWLMKDEKWGTVSYNNEVVIPFIYDGIHSLDGGDTRVWKGSDLIMVDNKGNCLENCVETGSKTAQRNK